MPASTGSRRNTKRWMIMNVSTVDHVVAHNYDLLKLAPESANVCSLRLVSMLRRAYQPSSASQVERRVFPSNTSTKQTAPARRFRPRQYVQLRTRTCLRVACVLTNQTGTHDHTNDEDGDADADNRPEDAGKPGEEAIGNGIHEISGCHIHVSPALDSEGSEKCVGESRKRFSTRTRKRRKWTEPFDGPPVCP